MKALKLSKEQMSILLDILFEEKERMEGVMEEIPEEASEHIEYLNDVKGIIAIIQPICDK